jgi:uncharacterized protein involved in exopolysaccharide biosynthesis
MTEPSGGPEVDVSLFALGTALLRARWRVARWMLIGAVVTIPFVAFRPALYEATASFEPEVSGADRSGLASLAGQFGISLPTANQSQSPDFYVWLLQSRVILQRVVTDTFVVPELGDRRVPFLSLFKIGPGSPALREERGTVALGRLLKTSADKLTGVVNLSVATRWPSVSLGIVQAMVDGVNEVNQKTRRGQASAERRFIEGRLAVAKDDLRLAEDRLEAFLKSNRQFASSPELTFTRDRLQRDITLKQQVFTALMQSYEDARIREVRDTPLITVIEPAAVSPLPRPRRRVLLTLLGAVLGAGFGGILVFFSELVRRVDRSGAAEAREFVMEVRELKMHRLAAVRRWRHGDG